MTVHILKLCVGIDSIEQLAQFQEARRAQYEAAGLPAEHVHRTRHRPRRAAEVLDGGSLYWIIKGFIRARQAIIRLDELYDDERGKRCGLVLGPDLVRTELRARRPHQGWRYLVAKDAPPDLPAHMQAGEWDADGHDGPPPEMAAELRALGLL
ncbi:MAG: DUF1489 domain-containing protein [Alphaproteobacteria bacterium]|jgi:hypothetical protein|nr:DUF1489 domain-containing protein [Alphaproteobacteria bacterium]MDP6832933.1 DUF1489 domain-containing protein [Alphaproteobacteria bacterium]MDP6873960.1 DUF1489 domain-containing protein [Alphaproteobacteria bacterium]